MKLLVFGGAGLLGRTFANRSGDHAVVPLTHAQVDIRDPASIARALDLHAPDAVIDCAAMTDVDRCESDIDAAWAVNAIGAGNVAMACHRAGARLVHISTDYVFAGDTATPRHEWDETDPRTAYGRSKLAGERAVRGHCPDHVIARTAWLYGPGGPSFLHTMLALGAKAGDPLMVVDDQRGSPTSTHAVVAGVLRVLEARVSGTIHLSCEGETTWYGFATEIFARARLSRALRPCTSAQYPRPAPRPADSRLEKRALRLCGLPPMPEWRDELALFLAEHPRG